MTINVFLLSLLGGYLLLTRFNATKYHCAGLSGYKFAYASAVVGVYLFLFAFMVDYLSKRSVEVEFFHGLVIPMLTATCPMLLYGSYRTAQEYKSKKFNETAASEIQDYDKFQSHRKNTLVASRFLFILTLFISSAAILHVVMSLPAPFRLWYWVAGIIGIILGVLLVNYIKQFSTKHGYEASYRLGYVLLVASLLFISWVVSLEYWVRAWWKATATIEYLGISFFAFAIGVVFPWVGNRLFPYKAAVERIIQFRETDSLQILFYTASKALDSVLLTLVDDKVYIGFVDREISIEGRLDDYVNIIPTASGYRDSKTKQLTLTTYYLEPFQKAFEDHEIINPMRMAKVIPISQIRSAGVFDPNYFAAFQEKVTENEDTE